MYQNHVPIVTRLIQNALYSIKGVGIRTRIAMYGIEP